MSLDPKMQDVYDRFIEDFMKKNPEKGASLAGHAFMLAHPEAWDNQAVYTTKLKDEDSEEQRKSDLEININALWTNEKTMILIDNPYVEKLTPKQISNYKKAIKAQGQEGYVKFFEAALAGKITDSKSLDEAKKAAGLL